jgi:hypothetical protein
LKFVKLLVHPVSLPFKDGHSPEHEEPLIGIRRITGLIYVKEEHRICQK